MNWEFPQGPTFLKLRLNTLVFHPRKKTTKRNLRMMNECMASSTLRKKRFSITGNLSCGHVPASKAENSILRSR